MLESRPDRPDNGASSLDPAATSGYAQWQIRPMHETDLPGILAIQAAAYPPELIESSTALHAKLQLAPESCWYVESNGMPQAYLFAHPWLDGLPPALDQPLACLPESCPIFYLHDLALRPEARGNGLGEALVCTALKHARARGHRSAALVAIATARSFWHRQGFVARAEPSAQLQEKLAAYGAGAHYLEASL